MASLHSKCAFCRIIRGETPSFKMGETSLSYAFLALPPVVDNHALVIPKYHAMKMHELPDEYLADAVALAKRIAIEKGFENYNLIQNNGRVAYQTVDHVHFHVINKPDAESGLMVTWPPQKSPEELEAYRERLFKERSAVGKTPL